MDFYFNQNIGDPANIFITIVAVAVGFVAGLAYIDKIRTKKNEQEEGR
ncbi:MAG: hypothetical protein JST43_05960 [Bacteroidetes bacterium]|nr:hypothetical protein [Bacteroidota bacterium]MBS1539338.1 hypothetical protein [Bacteroidota bacterium]